MDTTPKPRRRLWPVAVAVLGASAIAGSTAVAASTNGGSSASAAPGASTELVQQREDGGRDRDCPEKDGGRPEQPRQSTSL